MSKQEYLLSKNLKKLREKKELSQDRPAKLTDVANNTIIKIEQGENINPTLVKKAFSTLIKIEAGYTPNLSMKALIKIDDAFNIAIDELIGRNKRKA